MSEEHESWVSQLLSGWHIQQLRGLVVFFFFSRQYYEKEKDKLLDYWSPTEKRKRAIQRIMDDLGTPKYSAARRKVTQLTQINTHETNINNDHNCSSSKTKRKLSRFDVLPNQKWRNLKLPPIDEINYPH